MDELLKDKIRRIKSRRNRIRLSSRTVQAESRSIRTKWTREMACEIYSHHGIDSEKELEKILDQFQGYK